MASYKAEFLSHYYDGRVRPRSAYAMGFISVWAALASRVPGLVNALMQMPVSERLIKMAGGIAPERRLPGSLVALSWTGSRRDARSAGPCGPSVDGLCHLAATRGNVTRHRPTEACAC